MMYLRTVCVPSVLAHCTVIHSDTSDWLRQERYAVIYAIYLVCNLTQIKDYKLYCCVHILYMYSYSMNNSF